jgi:hypothetical protein
MNAHGNPVEPADPPPADPIIEMPPVDDDEDALMEDEAADAAAANAAREAAEAAAAAEAAGLAEVAANAAAAEAAQAAAAAAAAAAAQAAGANVAPVDQMQLQNMVMQAIALITPTLISGMANAQAVPSMQGPAQPFNGDGKVSWSDWSRTICNRFRATHTPQENWVPIVLSLLTGAAASYAQANSLTSELAWAAFAAAMAAGPWASKDTFFSLLFRLTRGNLGNGNPVETVTQLEKIRAKLLFTLPPQFWVFALLVNLAPAFRDSLLVAPNGKEWTSFEELRSVVVSKAAAHKSANPNGTNDKSSSAKNVSWKDKVKYGAANTTAKPYGDPGASSSTPAAHGKKRRTDAGPTCYGCGSPHHKISDRGANGKPLCPAYDANKERKGKSPMHPKFPGNGKGK